MMRAVAKQRGGLSRVASFSNHPVRAARTRPRRQRRRLVTLGRAAEKAAAGAVRAVAPPWSSGGCACSGA
eukprot:1665115-Prymnesium_polylepis.2